MSQSFISIYLRSNQILVFVDVLKEIGSPQRVCFMLSQDGKSLLLMPYEKRDLKSHSVPPEVYRGRGDYRINSYKLCHILADKHHWDLNRSYRVPGKIYPEKQMAVFNLASASDCSAQFCKGSK